MTLRASSFLALAAATTLLACERKTVVITTAPATPLEEPRAKTKTLETSRLGVAVDAYERNPSAENNAAVKQAVADLDSEIAELEVLVAKRSGADADEAAAKAKNMKSYRAAEVARFTAAQAKSAVGLPAPGDGRSGADKVEDGAKRVGNAIENAARKTGDAIKDVVR